LPQGGTRGMRGDQSGRLPRQEGWLTRREELCRFSPRHAEGLETLACLIEDSHLLPGLFPTLRGTHEARHHAPHGAILLRG